MRAIGRAAAPATPRGHASEIEHVLDGEFLLCLRCRRWMRSAPRAERARSYTCGPPCHRSVLARRVEADVELAAFTRAVTALCPDLARAQLSGAGPDEWSGSERPETPAEELRRWQMCDLSDRRAVVRTAYARGEVDVDGNVHPVRREPGAGA